MYTSEARALLTPKCTLACRVTLSHPANTVTHTWLHGKRARGPEQNTFWSMVLRRISGEGELRALLRDVTGMQLQHAIPLLAKFPEAAASILNTVSCDEADRSPFARPLAVQILRAHDFALREKLAACRAVMWLDETYRLPRHDGNKCTDAVYYGVARWTSLLSPFVLTYHECPSSSPLTVLFDVLNQCSSLPRAGGLKPLPRPGTLEAAHAAPGMQVVLSSDNEDYPVWGSTDFVDLATLPCLVVARALYQATMRVTAFMHETRHVLVATCNVPDAVAHCLIMGEFLCMGPAASKQLETIENRLTMDYDSYGPLQLHLELDPIDRFT